MSLGFVPLGLHWKYEYGFQIKKGCLGHSVSAPSNINPNMFNSVVTDRRRNI